MASKENKKYIIFGILIALAVIAFFLISTGAWRFVLPNQGFDPAKGITDESGQCVQPGRTGTMVIATCCKLADGREVPCEGTEADIPTGTQALIGTGTLDIASIRWGIQMDNSGNVPIDTKITGVTVTSSPSDPVGNLNIQTCFTSILNQQKNIKRLIDAGYLRASWTTTDCDLTWVSNTNPVEYTITINAAATANTKTATSSKPITMTLRAQQIGFSMDISCVGC